MRAPSACTARTDAQAVAGYGSVERALADKMAPFRVALSSDFLTASGAPAYPMFDLSPLAAAGVEYEYVQCVPGKGAEALTVPAQSVEGFDALILLAATFTADSIPSDGRLKLVARFGVGFDNVNVKACASAGIAVTITPDGVRRPVAVTVVNFMLTLASKLRAKERLARTSDWGSRSKYMGVGITDKTLGLLGLGNIGAEICTLVHPFDVKTIAYDPYVDPATAAKVGVELVDLDTLFKRSDFLSVNCPLNDETKGLVNAMRFAQMKDTAYVQQHYAPLCVARAASVLHRSVKSNKLLRLDGGDDLFLFQVFDQHGTRTDCKRGRLAGRAGTRHHRRRGHRRLRDRTASS